MGSDFSGFFIWFVGINFNPRSPDGERQVGDAAALFEDAFQSTLPGWGATPVPRIGREPAHISIHAPRMGSDHPVEHVAGLVEISIHAPRMGSDLPASLPIMPALAFQSTLPGWGATHGGPAQQ